MRLKEISECKDCYFFTTYWSDGMMMVCRKHRKFLREEK